MSGILQVLSVALAMVSVGTSLLSGYLLAPDTKGWRTAHVGWRQVLHLVAIYWMVAAVVAMRQPAAVVTPVAVFFAVAFALGGFAVLAWVVKHRPVRASRGRGL